MNISNKASQFISRKDVISMIDASAFAFQSGIRLNRIFNINLKHSKARTQDSISSFTKLASEWLALRDVPRGYVGVIEHPPMKSLNVHLLMHVPDHLRGAFARKEKGWLKKSGVAFGDGTLEIGNVGIIKGAKIRKLEDGEFLAGLEYKLGYMFKGADPETCALLHIDHKLQGIVYGKRICMSENIGLKARTCAGYKAPTQTRGTTLFRDRFRLSKPPTT